MPASDPFSGIRTGKRYLVEPRKDPFTGKVSLIEQVRQENDTKELLRQAEAVESDSSPHPTPPQRKGAKRD